MAEQHGRRAIVGAFAVVIADALLAGCGSSDAGAPPFDPSRPMSGLPVRTDLEPLLNRFPLLGRVLRAHWQIRMIGEDSLPLGPSDSLIQAVVVLTPGELARTTKKYTWRSVGSGWDERMSEALRPFAPTPGDWQHSAEFETDLCGPNYHSHAVYLDPQSGTVYFDVFTM